MENPFRVRPKSDIIALAVKTPVNAIAASGVVTFTGTPLAHVANVQASGTVTVTGTPVADENLVVGAQTFLFKASRGGVGQITISADNTAQAANIAAAITADLLTATATNTLGVVIVTSVAAGTAGNSIVLTTNATGVAVSGAGTLANGVDLVDEYIMVGAQKFTFVSARSGAGSFEITVNANNTTQGNNFVSALADVSNVTGNNNAGAVTVSAAVKGVAGNDSIALSESATGTSVTSVTGGKLDGGVDGTPGQLNEVCADANYMYRAVAENTFVDANWTRIATGAAF